MSGVQNKITKKRLRFNLKRVKAYTMLILSLFTISFFGFFALKPTLSTIASLNRQIEDNREIDQKLSKKINQLVAAQAEYEVIAPFIPKIKKALPEKPEYIGLLNDLESIRTVGSATISGISIDSVKIESKSPGLISISVGAQGSYIPLEDLVEKTLSNERLMVILSLNMSREKKLENTESLKFKENIS